MKTPATPQATAKPEVEAQLELYKTHRPKTFKGVLGQPEAVKVLSTFVANNSIPHAILFTGPSGCGKTTLGRILKNKLQCGEQDYTEINCADFRGIDMVREVRSRMQLAPMSGKVRIWFIDEAHKLSNDAQNAFLKILEDTPKHVYLFLATTDPDKLLTTVKTRCTEVRVRALGPSEVYELCKNVAEKEGVSDLGEELLDAIVEHGEGSARKVLVLLNQVLHLPAEARLDALSRSNIKPKAIELARAMLAPGTHWSDVAKLLKGLADEDPEGLRHMVLGYAKSVLLGGGKLAPRAALMIQAFERNFYDSKSAGLVLACYEVVTQGK
jgi:DNA polymerase III gamma/tau subunit